MDFERSDYAARLMLVECWMELLGVLHDRANPQDAEERQLIANERPKLVVLMHKTCAVVATAGAQAGRAQCKCHGSWIAKTHDPTRSWPTLPCCYLHACHGCLLVCALPSPKVSFTSVHHCVGIM